MHNEKTEETKLNEDKLLDPSPNILYVALTRLLYSDRCLHFYYINMTIALISLLVSILKLMIVKDVNRMTLYSYLIF